MSAADVEFLIVEVQGNICLGKSTLLAAIKADRNVLTTVLGGRAGHVPVDATIIVVPEPLDDWTMCEGVDLLKAFYGNMGAHAFLFEVHVVRTLAAHLTQTLVNALVTDARPTSVVIVVERSIAACRDIFARMLYDGGLLSAPEWATFLEVANFYERNWLAEVMRRLASRFSRMRIVHLAVLYGRVEPDELWRRVKARARPSEIEGGSALTLEYLKKLDAQHEKVFGAYDRLVIKYDPALIKCDGK